MARRFSLAVIMGAALLFLCTVAANVLFDPELVFGTNLFPQNINWNERVSKLRNYQRDADTTDALLFSSSRGNLLDRKLLAKDMGASHLLSMSMSFGMITDHLPLLEYILRDKAARGQHLKSVVLLLDPDFFGKPPWTNSNINSFLPPELSGESPVRYWWRYLTVFQYRLWRDVWRSRAQAHAVNPAERPGDTAPATEAIPTAARVPIPTIREDYRRGFNSVRPDLERQLVALKRFVELCRENNVQLKVAVNPIIDQNLDWHEPGVIDGLIARLAAVTPLWDFNAPPLVAKRHEFWLDFSHFDAATGTMMINRMFGTPNPPEFAEFGKLRGAAN
ncbi:MAG: hypothetical protein AB1342_03180 [Pseudomonadota bacterium]